MIAINPNLLYKALTLTVLAYAGYTVIKCPCPTFMCCSKEIYLKTLAVAAAPVIVLNYIAK